jgi:tetraacyldisaccharide 4'-kinase
MSFRDKTAAYFAHLMQDGGHSGLDRLILHMLQAASRLYAKGVETKYSAYADGSKQTKLPAYVISLGNITVGGTGKTPMACMLARKIQQQGFRVALLNRGYRSAEEHNAAVMSDGQDILLSAAEGGDEACLLARSLPGIPVLVGRNRAITGRQAIEEFAAEVLILDDAFQHWQLFRNLDIVLVDATNPFGNGYLLPRGILREPLSHLARAGLFIITKADQQERQAIDKLRQDLRRYNKKAPIAEAVHRTRWCLPFTEWNCLDRKLGQSCLSGDGRRAMAVSALGNPLSFENTVRSFGFDLVDYIRYDDHHQYTTADMAEMAERAKDSGAILVTTEKDAVKFPAESIAQYELPLYVLGIEIELTRGQADVDLVLHKLLGG